VNTHEARGQDVGDFIESLGCSHPVRFECIHLRAPSVGAEMRSLGRDEQRNWVVSEKLRRRNKFAVLLFLCRGAECSLRDD
jgi:hypothetical protein